MKTTAKTILIFILLGIISLFNGCDKKLNSKITYEGVVYDTLGGIPVTGVTVILRACKYSDRGLSDCNSFEVGNSITDSNGHFNIEGKEARIDRYAINIGHKFFYPMFSISKNDLKTSKYTILYLKE